MLAYVITHPVKTGRPHKSKNKNNPGVNRDYSIYKYSIKKVSVADLRRFSAL
jgi:hypothetical protein